MTAKETKLEASEQAQEAYRFQRYHEREKNKKAMTEATAS